P
ncbi:unnamed protein product, partial [Linum tenue]